MHLSLNISKKLNKMLIDSCEVFFCLSGSFKVSFYWITFGRWFYSSVYYIYNRRLKRRFKRPRKAKDEKTPHMSRSTFHFTLLQSIKYVLFSVLFITLIDISVDFYTIPTHKVVSLWSYVEKRVFIPGHTDHVNAKMVPI